MLINLSNHPSKDWGKTQKELAIEKYSSIFDIDFPAIDPEWETDEIIELTDEYFDKIISIKEKISDDLPFAVHIQGEFTFVFSLVNLLLDNNITAIASTSKRIVHTTDKGKIIKFDFVKFRKYSK